MKFDFKLLLHAIKVNLQTVDMPFENLIPLLTTYGFFAEVH